MDDPSPSRPTVARLVAWLVDGHTIRVLLLVSMLGILVGCDLVLDGPEHNPSVVGVIESRENLNARIWHYELATGESLEIDFDEPITLLDDALGGDPGALLFYGEDQDPWYFVLERYVPEDPPHSFRFEASAADDDTHIVFENGLRLPKAAGFDGRGWPQDGRYDSPAGEAGFAPFCINERGEVTAYLAMPSDQREGCPDAG
jgi:hypothetical protein